MEPRPRANVQVRIRERSAVRVVEIEGEFDLFSAERPKQVLRTLVSSVDPSDGVIIDLRECHNVDASGLAALISVGRIADSRGVKVALVLGASVRRIIRITEYKLGIPVYASLEEALIAGVGPAAVIEAETPAEVSAGV